MNQERDVVRKKKDVDKSLAGRTAEPHCLTKGRRALILGKEEDGVRGRGQGSH